MSKNVDTRLASASLSREIIVQASFEYQTSLKAPIKRWRGYWSGKLEPGWLEAILPEPDEQPAPAFALTAGNRC